jgi:hypothetical protein
MSFADKKLDCLMVALVWILSSSLCCTAQAATELPWSIEGQWIQGGLLYGQTAAGTRIRFLDNDVYVDEQGRFLLGLGRDAPEQVEVLATAADGSVHRTAFPIQ